MKIDNAIIMAAGYSSRFAPLSYETPKSLIRVKGEILLERQIEQLKSSGIVEIILVVGYKKEMFDYLVEKYGVIIIENSEYNIRNNHSSLWTARNYLKNSYICSSDNYFMKNPFYKQEEYPFYSVVYEIGKTEEWCVTTDSKGWINNVLIGGTDSWIMMGHALFSKEFSKCILKHIESKYDDPDTINSLWEKIYKNNIEDLRLMAKKNNSADIFEFDSLDDLREFDESYKNHSNSKIMEYIARELQCNEGEISNFKPKKCIKKLEVIGVEFTFNNEIWFYGYNNSSLYKI